MQSSHFRYLKFLSIKLFAITYYSILYFILGFLSSVLLNYIIPVFQNTIQVTTSFITLIKLIIEIFFNFAAIGIMFFFIRKIIKNYIPFPFNGVYGFQKSFLKEIQGGVIIAPIIMIFQTKLLSKLEIIKNMVV